MAKVTRVKIELNRKGVRALLCSDEVLEDLATRVGKMYEALPKGDGEEWSDSAFVGKDKTGGRAMARLITVNYEARRAAADGALIRALDAGR